MEKSQHPWVSCSVNADQSLSGRVSQVLDWFCPWSQLKGQVLANTIEVQVRFLLELHVCPKTWPELVVLALFSHRKQHRTKFWGVDWMCCVGRIWVDQRIWIEMQLTMWCTLSSDLVYKQIAEAHYIFSGIHFRAICYIVTTDTDTTECHCAPQVCIVYLRNNPQSWGKKNQNQQNPKHFYLNFASSLLYSGCKYSPLVNSLCSDNMMTFTYSSSWD